MPVDPLIVTIELVSLIMNHYIASNYLWCACSLAIALSAPIDDEGENNDSSTVGRGDYHYYSFSTKNDAIVTCSS